MDDDPKAAALVGAASAHPSAHVSRKIQQLISLKAAKQYRYPFPESERSDLVSGQDRIELGTTFTGSSYTLDADDLTKHLLVVGTTGMGKTTLFYHLMDELPVPYWAFDLKTDYRHLRRRNRDLLVIPWTRLRLNPLRPPPQVRPRTWAQTVLELIGDSYSLYSGSQNYLLPIVIDMYEEHDIDVDTRYSRDEVCDLPWPRFPQLRAYLQQSGKTGASRTSLRNRLIDRFGSILAATGDMYTESHGYPLAALLDRDVVFELQGLKTEHQDFLIEFLLTWVFRYRQARQDRGEGLQHAFVLDEGKRAFSIYKERDDTKGLPQIDVLTAQMREFGEALLVGDQEPNKLTDALRTNTGTTALFRLEEGEQFAAMARSLQLSEQQRSFADRLDVGQAIVKQGGRDAVPVQFPHVDVDKTVTDDELERDLQAVWTELAGSVSDGDMLQNAEPESVALPETGGSAPVDSAESVELDLSENAEWLLKDVAEHAFRPVTERYEQMASRYKGDKAKKELVENELVEPKVVQIGRGRTKLLELTDAGTEYLADQGVEVERRGRGGIKHQFWQHTVKESVSEYGGTAVIEQDDADVAVKLDGERIAVEVAMGNNEREIDHVEKHLDGGFDRVVVACRNRSVRDALRERCEDNGVLDDSVGLRLVREFVDVDSLPL